MTERKIFNEYRSKKCRKEDNLCLNRNMESMKITYYII